MLLSSNERLFHIFAPICLTITVVRETLLTQHFLESYCSKVPNVIKFYTGFLSYPRLMAVFNFLSSALVENYLLSHYKRSARQAGARRELEGISRDISRQKW